VYKHNLHINKPQIQSSIAPNKA